MERIPVLFVTSKEIDLSVLNDSPRFPDYCFRALAALPLLQEGPPESARARLAAALAACIESTRPGCLIFHLGLAFDRFPAEFLGAVLDTRLAHPEITIKLDRPLEYLTGSLRLWRNVTPQTLDLLDALALHPGLFETDDETAQLVGCLH